MFHVFAPFYYKSHSKQFSKCLNVFLQLTIIIILLLINLQIFTVPNV